MTRWFFRKQKATGVEATVVPLKTGTPTSQQGESAGRQSSDLRTWEDTLHLFVLTSFAIAQPVYDRLTERPAFLIDYRIQPGVIVFIAICLSLICPLLLVAVERLALRIGHRLYNRVHLTLVGICLFLLALPVCKLVIPNGSLVIVGACTLSLGGCWCYRHIRAIALLLTYASPGVLIFPALLLYYSPVMARNGGVTASRRADFDSAPVVMLVLDEFCGSSLMTTDRVIDADRFPNFAALSKEATWYRNATTVADHTEQAVPALLSGKYPQSQHQLIPGDVPQNLFSVLHTVARYEMTAFEPVSRLMPSTLNEEVATKVGMAQQAKILANVLGKLYLFYLTPSDFQKFLPKVPLTWFGMDQERVTDPQLKRGVIRYSWGTQRDQQFEHFLRTIDGNLESTLHFMHVLLPHMPWCFNPAGRRYAEDGDDWNLLDSQENETTPGSLHADEFNIIQQQQRYLLQAMYVDQLIGRLVRRLKESGQYDRCMFIVTADHGISFRAGVPRRNLDAGNRDEIMSVPLFIKLPGQRSGGVSDRHVESVDVFPTIADVLGITLLAPTDGRSLLDSKAAERDRKTIVTYTERLEVDPKVIEESRVPETIRQRFSDGQGADALFRIGPHPRLVGLPVDSFVQLNGEATILEFQRFSDVLERTSGDETSRGEVPGFFEGRVKSPVSLDAPVSLAVSVNGVIRGCTRTYQPAQYRDRFTLLIPEDSFKPGKNDVRFFTITLDDPSNIRLTPCRVSIADPHDS